MKVFCMVIGLALLSAARLNAAPVDDGAYVKLSAAKNTPARIAAIDDYLARFFRNQVQLSNEQYAHLLMLRTQSCRQFASACFDLKTVGAAICESLPLRLEVIERFHDSVFLLLRKEDQADKLLATVNDCKRGIGMANVTLLMKILSFPDKRNWPSFLVRFTQTFSTQIANVDEQTLARFLPQIGQTLGKVLQSFPIPYEFWARLSAAIATRILDLDMLKTQPAPVTGFIFAASDFLPVAGHAEVFLKLVQALPDAVKDELGIRYSFLVLQSCWAWQDYGHAQSCLDAIEKGRTYVQFKPDVMGSFRGEEMLARLFLGQDEAAAKLRTELEARPHQPDPMVGFWLTNNLAIAALGGGDLAAAERHIYKLNEYLAKFPRVIVNAVYAPKFARAILLRRKGETEQAMKALDALKLEMAKYVYGTANGFLVSIETERLFNAFLMKDFPLALQIADDLAQTFETAPFSPAQRDIVAGVRLRMHLRPYQPVVDRLSAFYGADNFKVRNLVEVLRH